MRRAGVQPRRSPVAQRATRRWQRTPRRDRVVVRDDRRSSVPSAVELAQQRDASHRAGAGSRRLPVGSSASTIAGSARPAPPRRSRPRLGARLGPAARSAVEDPERGGRFPRDPSAAAACRRRSAVGFPWRAARRSNVVQRAASVESGRHAGTRIRWRATADPARTQHPTPSPLERRRSTTRSSSPVDASPITVHGRRWTCPTPDGSRPTNREQLRPLDRQRHAARVRRRSSPPGH
jgi:hypothetical protein